jgi:hypothetical protein
VTANFIPGYRLSVAGGTGTMQGGLPGTEININPWASPGPGYTFEGWYLNGPGYLLGNRMIMGKGPVIATAAWWAPNAGPLPRSYLVPDQFFVMRGGPFTVNVTTTCAAALTVQQLDYSTDHGQTWHLGTVAEGTRWQGTALSTDDNWIWRSSKALVFGTEGIVIFRAKAESEAAKPPVYAYTTVRVLNQDAATILYHPLSLTIAAGQKAQFDVTAEGTGSILYRWHKNGVVIPGATNRVLVIESAKLGDAGDYSASVTNTGTWVFSQTARLTVVGTPPTISSQPSSISVSVGSPTSFLVVPGGSHPFSFQWQKNGAAIPGATSAEYQIPSTQLSDAGNYNVVVSNDWGTLASALAILEVSDGEIAPSITNHPSPLTLNPGETAIFLVTASGTSLTYQWRRNGTALANGVHIAGVSTDSLTVTGVIPSDTGDYDVVVTNTAGRATSNAATLVVPA